MIDGSHRDSTGGSVHCGAFLAWKMLYELRRDNLLRYFMSFDGVLSVVILKRRLQRES